MRENYRNTLTITETKIILEDGITIGKGKTLREHLEVINHYKDGRQKFKNIFKSKYVKMRLEGIFE